MGPGFSAPPAAAVLREAQLSCPRLCLLQKEKHPANSIKNVSHRAGKESVRSAVLSSNACIQEAGAWTVLGQMGRDPPPVDRGPDGPLIPKVCCCLEPRASGPQVQGRQRDSWR